jgi:glycine/D-amino acid oxidase-like deaminating enzyme
MPTPGVGYKVGLDTPLRPLRPEDHDRTPDAGRTAELTRRIRTMFPGAAPAVVDEQVCTWTDSPDGRFVIDRIGDGVVLACGDSGEGFKYSALMGEILADLAEGRPADEDAACFCLDRLSGLADDPDRPPTSLGRSHTRSA